MQGLTASESESDLEKISQKPGGAARWGWWFAACSDVRLSRFLCWWSVLVGALRPLLLPNLAPCVCSLACASSDSFCSVCGPAVCIASLGLVDSGLPSRLLDQLFHECWAAVHHLQTRCIDYICSGVSEIHVVLLETLIKVCIAKPNWMLGQVRLPAILSVIVEWVTGH